MGTGNSGTYNVKTGSSVISGYVEWVETYDDATYLTTNQTTVTQKVYLHRTNTYANNYNVASSGTRTAYFGSETVVNKDKQTLTIGPNPPGNYTCIFTASKVITHDENGSKTITLGVETDNNANVGGFEISKTTANVTLMTIPRKSTAASLPNFTVGDAATVTINRASTAFTHTVYMEIPTNDAENPGSWYVMNGELTGVGDSGTFNSTAFTESVLSALYNLGKLYNGASTRARWEIVTYNASTYIGSTTSAYGTVYGRPICSYSWNNPTVPSAITVNISKPISGYWNRYYVSFNGTSLTGAGITTSAGSFSVATDGSTVISLLQQSPSKTYYVDVETYYGNTYLGKTSFSGTIYAPAADTAPAPNWTLGNQFYSSISTANSSFTRSAVLQLLRSDNVWITVASQDNSPTTTFYWDGVVDFWNAAFPVMGSRSSCSARVLVTSYYNGVQIRSTTESSWGTCYAPAVTTCSAPNWTAGWAFTCNFTRSLSCLTYNVTLQVKNSANNYVTVESYSNLTNDTVYFTNTTALNTNVFNLLAQAGTREAIIYVDTYYGSTKIRSTWSATGTVTAPNASTCATIPNWIGGDTLGLTINRTHDDFSHTVNIEVNSQTVATLTGVGTSVSFGTSATERINIYNALAQASSRTSRVVVTTYYNGVQIRTATAISGTCYAPGAVIPTVPTWTAGNSFSSTISLSKDYLVYSIQLKVGTQDIQSYSYQTATTLGFAGTTALNLLAYKGLNGAASATSQFIVTMYYPKGDGTYIQVGPPVTTNGTCTALEASTITAPNWTAGSTFTATVTKKSLNLYETIKLKVNGQVVQEYPIQSSTSLTYALTFANTKDINTKIYTALEQASSKVATLEIVTYFGTDVTNVAQVRSTVIATGSCNASEATVGNLTLSQTPAIIDNTEITCNLTKALPDYTVIIEVSCNGVAITNLTPADTETSALFNSANYINELYQSIPTQKSGSLQFKIITYYNGVQVQQPRTVAVDINANEATVKVKINEAVSLTTKANVFTEVEKVFIDDTSMIASKLSNLAISIAEGYFYLENKYGGYITQIRAQISNSSGMMQSFNFTSNDIKLNNENTRIVSSAFAGDKAIVMGPYDFMDVTTAGTVYNLNIVATDSRGYSVTKVIPLKIFPYSAPTIKLDKKETKRGTGDENKYFIIDLSGTISSLFTESTGEKVQTNLIDTLSLEYKVYGSTDKYSIYNITLYTYNDTYTAYSLNKFSTAGKGISDFDIASTYELKVTVKDTFGKTNSDSIIILPDRPALSFRDQRLGINIIPRKLGEFTERSSDDVENPSLDVNGYIYSNGREVPTFVYQMKENDKGELVIDEWTI